jgi:hypothetical protein
MPPSKEGAPRRKVGRPIGSIEARSRKRRVIEISRGRTPVTDSDDGHAREPLQDVEESGERTLEIAVGESQTIACLRDNEEPGGRTPDTGLGKDHLMSILQNVKESDPKSLEEAQGQRAWPKCEAAMQEELRSLEKRQVLSDALELPMGCKPMGYRWVFALKKDASGKVVRYKASLLAKGYAQTFGLDYSAIYAPVVDATT